MHRELCCHTLCMTAQYRMFFFKTALVTDFTTLKQRKQSSCMYAYMYNDTILGFILSPALSFSGNCLKQVIIHCEHHHYSSQIWNKRKYGKGRGSNKLTKKQHKSLRIHHTTVTSQLQTLVPLP